MANKGMHNAIPRKLGGRDGYEKKKSNTNTSRCRMRPIASGCDTDETTQGTSDNVDQSDNDEDDVDYLIRTAREMLAFDHKKSSSARLAKRAA